MPSYVVKKPFVLPGGAIAGKGETVPMTERQAKYLLLAGKVDPADARKQSGKKKVAVEAGQPVMSAANPSTEKEN